MPGRCQPVQQHARPVLQPPTENGRRTGVHEVPVVDPVGPSEIEPVDLLLPGRIDTRVAIDEQDEAKLRTGAVT